MGARLQWASLLLLMSVGTAHAAQLGVLWQFDRAFVPAPGYFVVTATQVGGGQQQLKVPLHAPGACTRLPGGTEDHFCTVLACPAPGSIVAYWVQAVWPDETTGPVEVVTCWFRPGPEACVCQDPATMIPASLPPLVAAPMPPAPTPPPLQTTPPPLPQRTAEGLNLQQIAALPALPTLPPLPARGGT